VNTPRPTVFVVEDHAVTRAGLSAILGEHGYAVATAPDGKEALSLLFGGLVVDVVLLDMLMPEVDGWHFLEKIKHTRFADLPIVVMTGVGLSDEWAAANGCFGYLRKPFDERDLLAMVSRAIAPR
jgi:CheY-like chemotaxis protein